MPLMQWERLATVRTVVLIVVGLGSLVVAAWFGLGIWWGVAVLGVSALFLEFMTGERGEPQRERR
jgi:hypothetical protein